MAGVAIMLSLAIVWRIGKGRFWGKRTQKASKQKKSELDLAKAFAHTPIFGEKQAPKKIAADQQLVAYYEKLRLRSVDDLVPDPVYVEQHIQKTAPPPPPPPIDVTQRRDVYTEVETEDELTPPTQPLQSRPGGSFHTVRGNARVSNQRSGTFANPEKNTGLLRFDSSTNKEVGFGDRDEVDSVSTASFVGENDVEKWVGGNARATTNTWGASNRSITTSTKGASFKPSFFHGPISAREAEERLFSMRLLLPARKGCGLYLVRAGEEGLVLSVTQDWTIVEYPVSNTNYTRKKLDWSNCFVLCYCIFFGLPCIRDFTLLHSHYLCIHDTA